ncbi:hypothetical protein [Geomobilimonas luticola]|uniref:Uncharacterized protein n=1 Tax=Geomobilimonas luticola TaxID=1114878 RepID=A0ABS5SDD6_9BACT|nr:hypothetical protein [Geomobilimonas luticola]MBT0653394.1 hypothetical protein [Geomobilimonas luticola]
MTIEKDDLAELEKEVRKLLDDNRKFLERVLDDDFEPEETVDDEGPEVAEEL